MYLDTNVLAYVANTKAPQHGGIFDLLHIAIMLSHQVTSIYTFNVKDFSWCSEIKVIDPSHL
ncbi:hypothetical protein BCD67_00915 [Oscillatoriales cyanobacterium USR001]|nr:hypothetical protein BCD67_00915 [Oscillatoriales cyanobacterium USR001]